VIDITAIKARFDALAPFLDERARRLFAASEARAAGRGGVVAVSRATGIARSTIDRGLADLRTGVEQLGGRVRRAGGGGKPAIKMQPGILAALNELVQSSIRGDPEAALLWVSKSQRHLSAALAERGFTAGQKLVGRLLHHLGFSLQANAKTREGAGHPDRNAQFEHINAKVLAAQASGQAVVSVDTKKKELVGAFKNGGSDYRPKGDPRRVKVHDFEDKALGKVVPYGVYDVAADQGWVSVGITADTAEFAVASIREWLTRIGRERYPQLRELTITADCGGSNGARVRLWKRELQRFADETGLLLHVHHYPPGTSKWNKIEHRLFCRITQNWRGRPLTDRLAVVELIGATTTTTGLKVECALDTRTYEKGVKVSDAEMANLNITGDAFHPDWNYTVNPRQPAKQ
jgi:hypothetical protein